MCWDSKIKANTFSLCWHDLCTIRPLQPLYLQNDFIDLRKNQERLHWENTNKQSKTKSLFNKTSTSTLNFTHTDELTYVKTIIVLMTATIIIAKYFRILTISSAPKQFRMTCLGFYSWLQWSRLCQTKLSAETTCKSWTKETK